jgi:peptidoglycan/LPS O-acetylase OafA/YrhL
MRETERYDPKIDALRGISFSIVFIGHFSYENQYLSTAYNFAPFGVVLFFCLSGFLLGRVVFREFEKTQRISITRFFLRRAFRILPLYIVFLTLIYLLSQFSKLGNDSFAISEKEWIHLLTFSYNLISFSDATASPLPAVTWSLSIEEQIYLFFPFISLLFARKKYLYLSIVLPVLIFTLVLAQTYFLDGASVDRLTGLYLFPVLIGMLCAYFEKQILNKTISKLRYFLQMSIVLSVLIALLKYSPSSSSGYVLGVLVIGSAFPMVLNLSGFKHNGVILNLLSRIGRVSFGCYLYHWIFWNLLQKFSFAFNDSSGYTTLGWSMGIIATLVISFYSYRFIELPFLSIRRRFQVVETS